MPKPFVGTGAVRIVTSPDTGAVRPVFNYHGQSSRFATFSGKAARQLYCESATEMAALRDAEIKTEYVDMQFQPLSIEWLQPDGRWRSYTFDAGFELEDGTLVFDEFKATASQFTKPKVKAKLGAAATVMRNYGVRVRSRDGSQIQHRADHTAVKALWDVRRTNITETDRDRARELLDRAGGQLALSRFLAGLHLDVNIAFGKAAALMMHRVVRINLEDGLEPDAVVSIPPPAVRGRLRSFLAQFAA